MKNVVLLIGLGLIFTACVTPPPPLTQLQIREFQTREYDVQDINMAMKAALNVLQDEGYIIKQADSNLGFLNAIKETEAQGSRFSRIMVGSDGIYDSATNIECTVNVTMFNNRTRVRANFIRKVLNNRGGVSTTEHIKDQAFYQAFFSKVDKGMFIQKENL